MTIQESIQDDHTKHQLRSLTLDADSIQLVQHAGDQIAGNQPQRSLLPKRLKAVKPKLQKNKRRNSSRPGLSQGRGRVR